jgi:hypothetical protein
VKSQWDEIGSPPVSGFNFTRLAGFHLNICHFLTAWKIIDIILCTGTTHKIKTKGEIAMNDKAVELKAIITKFAESGWDLIDAPSKAWLVGENNKAELIAAIEQADIECGSCGCEYDALYKQFLAMKELV